MFLCGALCVTQREHDQLKWHLNKAVVLKRSSCGSEASCTALSVSVNDEFVEGSARPALRGITVSVSEREQRVRNEAWIET